MTHDEGFALEDIQLFWVGDSREPIRPQIEPTVLCGEDGMPSHVSGIQEDGSSYTEAVADITSVVVQTGDLFHAIAFPDGLTEACGFEGVW